MEHLEKIEDGLKQMQAEMLRSEISIEKKILFNIQILGLLEAVKTLGDNIWTAYEELN